MDGGSLYRLHSHSSWHGQQHPSSHGLGGVGEGGEGTGLSPSPYPESKRNLKKENPLRIGNNISNETE